MNLCQKSVGKPGECEYREADEEDEGHQFLEELYHQRTSQSALPDCDNTSSRHIRHSGNNARVLLRRVRLWSNDDDD